jgi:hypothetical protein
MNKWIALLLIILSLGLSIPAPQQAHAMNLQQQMQNNQSQLLDLWLREEAVIIMELQDIDYRLTFRIPRHVRAGLLQAKQLRLQKLSYVRSQITGISMQLYGRPRP